LIRILADKNLYKLSDFLPVEVDLKFYDPNLNFPDLETFDAFLIRSITKIQKDNYKKISPTIKFIGTGSSGKDHVDEDLISKKGLHFVDAKGSNADVVAEYVATSLITLNKKDKRISKARIGIVGVGAVGSKVNELLQKLDYETVLFDPPRKIREPDFESVSLNKILNCDILTFHIPLNQNNYHWFNSEKLAKQNYLAIINASRGGVVDERAVLKSKLEGKIDYIVSDVWENEPNLNIEFMQLCDIATPHIAGSSIQSKMNASKMLAEEVCNFFGLKSPIGMSKPKEKIYFKNLSITTEEIISEIHPLLVYDSKLRELSNNIKRETLFAKLRTDFPLRNEYTNIRIMNIDLCMHPILKKLGISN
jgi:erythronate-4-phosphate dehydrogenase